MPAALPWRAWLLNRAMDPRFPSNICDVIKQRKMQGNVLRCQFSWYCENKADAPMDPKVWRDSLKIAAAVLQRDSAIPDPTGGALWYHASFTRPSWAIGFESTTIIGMHVFYREPDDLHGTLPARKPFIYRLNAFAEFVAHRGTHAVTVAMAPEARIVIRSDEGRRRVFAANGALKQPHRLFRQVAHQRCARTPGHDSCA